MFITENLELPTFCHPRPLSLVHLLKLASTLIIVLPVIMYALQLLLLVLYYYELYKQS